jgi:hypothetical protein
MDASSRLGLIASKARDVRWRFNDSINTCH